MNTKHSLIALSIVSLLATSPAIFAGKGGNRNNNQTTAELSTVESDTLLFMREEEKLARDVYITLFEQWNNRIFDNISTSEQKHMDTMKTRLDGYGLTDPISDDSVGAFNNTQLEALYWELIEKGQVSEMDALHVGAFIEEIDMIDLQEAIDNSSHADITRSYKNLLRGSESHLRAFVRQIENRGVDYEAQEISQDELDEIVD